MLKFLLVVTCIFSWNSSFAQNNDLRNSLLFDDSDIIIKAPDVPETIEIQEQEKQEAISQAKNLLNKKPNKLKLPDTINTHKPSKNIQKLSKKTTFSAPFGLLWNSTIKDTRNQGIKLTPTEIKDYPNSFQASNLPKPLSFFTRIYVSFGETDELFRILTYSQLIDDNPSASKVLSQYKTYSELLNKKYGNMKQNFQPAIISKTITNKQGKEETITEESPIGNPNFLTQLESGEAVLFSTFHNENIEATLSIGVDGDKKSYIVIDYLNLQILKQKEVSTFDAL